MIFNTPKISDKPDAMRNRNIAVVRPDRSCPSRKTGSSSSDMARVPMRRRDKANQLPCPAGLAHAKCAARLGGERRIFGIVQDHMKGLGSTYFTSVMVALPSGPLIILP